MSSILQVAASAVGHSGGRTGGFGGKRKWQCRLQMWLVLYGGVGISEVYKLKSKGTNTEPCGTPAEILMLEIQLNQFVNEVVMPDPVERLGRVQEHSQCIFSVVS